MPSMMFQSLASNENRILLGFWAVVDFFLLAAGILCIAASFIWRRPNDPFFNFQLSTEDLNGGLAIGILLVVSFLVSIPAIMAPKPRTGGLKIFNLFLIGDSIALVVVGTIIWFQTLIIIAKYQTQWDQASDSTKTFFQDKFSCCGYQNGTDIFVGGNFCSNQTFAQAQQGCVLPIVEASQYTLGQIFTVIYGFMPVTLSLLFATLALINKRVEEDRFRKIDEKRGGGFV